MVWKVDFGLIVHKSPFMADEKDPLVLSNNGEKRLESGTPSDKVGDVSWNKRCPDIHRPACQRPACQHSMQSDAQMTCRRCREFQTHNPPR